MGERQEGTDGVSFICRTATGYVVRMYSKLSASQHTFRNALLDFVWKLSDLHCNKNKNKNKNNKNNK